MGSSWFFQNRNNSQEMKAGSQINFKIIADVQAITTRETPHTKHDHHHHHPQYDHRHHHHLQIIMQIRLFMRDARNLQKPKQPSTPHSGTLGRRREEGEARGSPPGRPPESSSPPWPWQARGPTRCPGTKKVRKGCSAPHRRRTVQNGHNRKQAENKPGPFQKFPKSAKHGRTHTKN